MIGSAFRRGVGLDSYLSSCALGDADSSISTPSPRATAIRCSGRRLLDRQRGRPALPWGRAAIAAFFMLGDMTIQRMDNVGIVVDDLDAADVFFTELGMELEGPAQIQGRW